MIVSLSYFLSFVSTGDELFSDTYKIVLKDECLYEVYGKVRPNFIVSNHSIEGFKSARTNMKLVVEPRNPVRLIPGSNLVEKPSKSCTSWPNLQSEVAIIQVSRACRFI